jgi:hypothetical protein
MKGKAEARTKDGIQNSESRIQNAKAETASTDSVLPVCGSSFILNSGFWILDSALQCPNVHRLPQKRAEIFLPLPCDIL